MNSIKKYFFSFFLIISILLIIYVFYKSEIYWDGSKRDYYLQYYIFFSLIIIFSLITFFLNEKLREYLIISVISIIFSIYIFEIYLIFNSKFDKKQKIELLETAQINYEKKTGRKYDKRTKYEVYNELKKIDDTIQVTIPPTSNLKKNFPLFPLSGISNSKTIFCNENGYYVFYESDRFGFRNPDKEWDRDTIEYLLIGDSYTHGACVNEPDDIASVLRKMSNESVLNLGYSSNGPLIEYAILREYLPQNVKKIVWIYFESNDLNDLSREIQSETLKKYLNNLNFTQNLKLKQKTIDEILSKNVKISKEKKKNESIRQDLIKFVKLEKTIDLFVQPNLPKSDLKKILELVKDLALKNNSELFFVFLPSYNRYIDNHFDNKNYDFIKKTVNDLDIEFIDIDQEVFKKVKNPLKFYPFELQYHFNEYGYKSVAETIYNFIKD